MKTNLPCDLHLPLPASNLMGIPGKIFNITYLNYKSRIQNEVQKKVLGDKFFQRVSFEEVLKKLEE